MYAESHTPNTKLEKPHYEHLLSEGFTPDEITKLEIYGLKSISSSEAASMGIKKWNGTRHINDGGLWFPFTEDYGQIRFNTPLIANGKAFKYLGPSAPVKAWFPPEGRYEAITEGWKDAAMPTVRGVTTAAIAGVSNIIYSVPQDCQRPIIFDSDGWYKPQVVMALIVGALWTNGKINLFPPMNNYPTGGACEFFKNGGTIGDYQKLIDEAMKPADFLKKWISHWETIEDPALKSQCASAAAASVYRLQNAHQFISVLESKVLAKQSNESVNDAELFDPLKALAAV
jgi:hypothetical protein